MATRATRVQDVGRALPWPGHHPGVELRHRVELELERRHHPEASADTAQRPEETGLVLSVHAQVPSIGGDDLGRDHAVARQAVLARKPAVPTPQL
jgi:hypothetical protein